MSQPPATSRPYEEPPPFLGSWNRIYAGVVAYLALLIVLFYLFARAYSS